MRRVREVSEGSKVRTCKQKLLSKLKIKKSKNRKGTKKESRANTVQFKMVSMRSGKPMSSPPRLSETPPTLLNTSLKSDFSE